MIRDEIRTVLKTLKRERRSILVVDKNVDALATFADRHVVVEKGRVVWTGTTADLRSDAPVRNRYLHV